MIAKVTVQLIDDDKQKKSELSTIVTLHPDVAIVAADEPVGALFWIFQKAETQMVALVESAKKGEDKDLSKED